MFARRAFIRWANRGVEEAHWVKTDEDWDDSTSTISTGLASQDESGVLGV